jgi:mycofactocin precursor
MPAVAVTVEPENPISDDGPELVEEVLLVEEDLLVEDVSIDGMCGVYSGSRASWRRAACSPRDSGSRTQRGGHGRRRSASSRSRDRMSGA